MQLGERAAQAKAESPLAGKRERAFELRKKGAPQRSRSHRVEAALETREQTFARSRASAVGLAESLAARGALQEAAALAEFLAPTADDPLATLLIAVRSRVWLG